MLASYTKDNGIHFLWKSLNDVSQITPEVEKQLSKLINKTIFDTNKIARKLKITDKTVISFMKSMEGTSTVFKTSEQAMAGYQAYLKSTGKLIDLAGLKTKALSLSMKALSTIGWTVAISAATFLIEQLIGLFVKMAHEQENIRAQAIAATNTYKEQNDALDSNIQKYKDIKKALSDENLSIDESRAYKEQLLAIQNNLVESFSDEANNLNLVNGKYEEQLELLENISKKKAEKLIAENASAFEDADRELHKERTYTTTVPLDDDEYFTKEQLKLRSFINSYNDAIKVTQRAIGPDRLGPVTLTIKGDVNSAKDLMYQFSKDLRSWSNTNGIDAEPYLQGVSKQLTKINADDSLKEYQAIYDEFITAQVLSDDSLREKYKDSLEAVESYNTAYDSGSEDDILAAKENLDQVRNSLQLTEDEVSNLGSVYDEIFAQAKTGLYDFKEALKTDPSLKPITDYVKDSITFDYDGNYSGFNGTNLKAAMETQLEDAANRFGLSTSEIINEIFGSSDVQDSIINALNTHFNADATDELNQFFKSNSINTEEEVSKFLAIADSVNTLNEAEKKYLEQSPKTGDSFSGILATQKDAIDNVQSSVAALDGALEKISSGTLNSGEMTDLIQQFPALEGYLGDTSNGFANLKTGIEKIKAQQVDSLIQQLQKLALQADGETKTSINHLINTLREISPDSITTTINSLSQAVKDSQQLLIDYNQLDNVISSGMMLTNEQVISLTNRYPELQSAIYKTAEGWHIEGNALDTLRGKLGGLEAAYLSAQKQMTELLNSDVGTRLKMLGIEATAITSMADAYAEIEKLRQKPQSSVNDDGSIIDNVYPAFYHSQEVEDALLLQGQLAELEKQLNNLHSNSGIYDNHNYDKNYNAQAQKEIEETNKTFDWMQRAFDDIERKRSSLQKQVDDETQSYNEQISTLQALIELDGQYIALNEEAKNTYSSRWDKARQDILNTFGDAKGYDILSKIQNGDLSEKGSMDTYTAAEADSIQSAIDSYDDLSEAQDKYDEAETGRITHLREIYAKRLAEVESYLTETQDKISRAESMLDLKEATGREVTEADYKNLLKLSKEQVSLYYDQIDALEEQLSMAEEGSSEYYSINSSIASCRNAIEDAKQSQAEWNEAIKDLPMKRIERFLELLGFIKEDLNNFMSEQESLGKNATSDQYQQLIDISKQQIDKLLEQQKLLKGRLGDYQFNSNKYNETASSIQDIDNEISGLIQSQYEWNHSILQMPVDNIAELNDSLSQCSSALGEILSDHETVLSAVNTAIENQIALLDEERKTVENSYDKRIEGVQDILDGIDEQNEKLRIQRNIEQSLYDLERAKNQKTNQVVRGGEIVYEADQNAIKDANQKNQDALLEKKKADLQDEIDALTEDKENALRKYDDEIEALEHVADRWGKIASNIEEAAEALKAAEILGEGWQDKIISGQDDDLYHMMSGLYESTKSQKDNIDKQIASNERVADLMGKYVELWQNGSITYEDALSGIQDITLQMQDGFSSLESLDALLKLNEASDLSSLLEQTQNNAAQSVTQMADYLKVVKENSDALAEYVMTWDEMKQNIKDQVEALKVAAEALKNRPVSKPSSSHDDDGDNRGYRGPTDTYVNGEYVHTNDGWGNYYDKNTGEKVEDPAKNLDNILDKHKKHDGIASGLIGRSDKTRERRLKSLATNSLKPNETISKVLVGEAVLTRKQQEQLLKNFQLAASAATPVISLPEAVSANDAQSNVEVNMGNIVLQGVQDPDGLARAIKQNLSGIMRQELHKR